MSEIRIIDQLFVQRRRLGVWEFYDGEFYQFSSNPEKPWNQEEAIRRAIQKGRYMLDKAEKQYLPGRSDHGKG